jgi:hypothetical protein
LGRICSNHGWGLPKKLHYILSTNSKVWIDLVGWTCYSQSLGMFLFCVIILGASNSNSNMIGYITVVSAVIFCLSLIISVQWEMIHTNFGTFFTSVLILFLIYYLVSCICIIWNDTY